MREYGWVWPAYGFEQWAWDEMNGWYNPEDDPASPTETVLLDEIKRLRAECDDLRTMVDFPEVVAGYAGPSGSTCTKVIGNDDKEYLRRSWRNAITQWQWWHERYAAATGDTRGRTQIEMAERTKGSPS